MKSPLKAIGIAVGAIVGLIGLGIGGLYLLFWLVERPHTMGTYEVAPGVEVELFVEADWDVGDGLYYRITKNGKELVHTTYLTNHDRGDPLEISTFKNTAGTMVGLHSQAALNHDFPILIILDLQSGESWPRLRDDEVPYEPSVKAKWHQRYSALVANNPELPRPDYFEPANKAVEATADPPGS